LEGEAQDHSKEAQKGIRPQSVCSHSPTQVEQSQYSWLYTENRVSYTRQHLRKRLSFANGYGDWSEEEWKKVLFSDESHMYMGQHGQQWVQRPPNTEWSPEYTGTKVAHPERISIWACFSWYGLGDIEIFNDNMNGKGMKALLMRRLLPSAERLFKKEHWWLLQDNAPSHKASLVTNWLFKKGVRLLDFPPYSPDLNPIENLWSDLKRRVEQRNPRNVEELEKYLREEWKNTSSQTLQNLSSSMVNRCKAVVALKGYMSKY